MLSSDHDSDAGVSKPQKLLCKSPLTQHISSFAPTSCFSHSQKSKCPMSHLNSATRKQVPPHPPICNNLWFNRLLCIAVPSHH